MLTSKDNYKQRRRHFDSLSLADAIAAILAVDGPQSRHSLASLLFQDVKICDECLDKMDQVLSGPDIVMSRQTVVTYTLKDTAKSALLPTIDVGSVKEYIAGITQAIDASDGCRASSEH